MCVFGGEGATSFPPRPLVPFFSSQQQIACNYLTLKGSGAATKIALIELIESHFVRGENGEHVLK